MPRLPPRPNLSWTETGAPHADDFADIYFAGDGLSETRAVFLKGCNLPDAWAGRESFTVGELGFGSGLNLLALWDLWRANRPSPTARLHFVSFEGYPMAREDAARTHAHYTELADLSAALLAQWPVRARGVQRIHLPDNLTLTLHIDDITSALEQAEAQCNAWFLDGFAPSKNPDMWSPEAMRYVARLSAPGAIAATYTVAGAVRRNLTDAGFTVEKKPGHGAKRERLEAHLPGDPPTHQPPTNVAIIGAGIAGACAAHVFAKRGCNVTLVDAGPAPGAGASGNPTALVMPRLDATDTPEARALIEAWLYAHRCYSTLSLNAAQKLTATRLPNTDRDPKRFTKLLNDPPLPTDLLTPINPNDPAAGYALPASIAVRPSAALAELLGSATTRFNTSLTAINTTDRRPTLILSTGETLAPDLALICTGHALAELALASAPPITPRLGQIEHARNATADTGAITDGGYVVHAFGDLLFGSTFESASGPPETSDKARKTNLETLARLRPDIVAAALTPTLTSRAAIRATTPDRLPFAGPLFDPESKTPDQGPAQYASLQLIGGLGARGFLWAPLLAELIAARTFGEPLPVEQSIARSLDPDRFRRRAAKREG